MNNPKPEHRISFLEKQFVAMGGHLEGIQDDIEHLHQDMKKSFTQVGDMYMGLEGDIASIRQDIAALNTRFDEVNQGIADLKTGLLEALRDLKQKPGGEK